MRDSRRQHSALADNIKDILIVSLIYLVALLPLPVAHFLGSLIGELMWRLPGRSKQTTHTNVRYCFPDKPIHWQNELARQSLRETGKTMMETPAIWVRSPKHGLSLIKQVHGLEHLEKAMQGEHGVITMTPHLGQWELCHYYLSSIKPIYGMYKPPKFRRLGELIARSRSKPGSFALPTDRAGVKGMLKALKQKEILFIAPDQEPELSGGEFATLFGRPALTGTLTSKLVRNSKAEALMMYVRRLPKAQGFELIFKPPAPEIGNRDMSIALETLNRSIEECILENNSQYQWSYKRFKRRPEGETKLY